LITFGSPWDKTCKKKSLNQGGVRGAAELVMTKTRNKGFERQGGARGRQKVGAHVHSGIDCESLRGSGEGDPLSQKQGGETEPTRVSTPKERNGRPNEKV